METSNLDLEIKKLNNIMKIYAVGVFLILVTLGFIVYKSANKKII